MTLHKAIEKNRFKQARFKKAEILLRRLRQRIFDYEDISTDKGAQASRLIERCQKRLAPLWTARQNALECCRDVNGLKI